MNHDRIAHGPTWVFYAAANFFLQNVLGRWRKFRKSIYSETSGVTRGLYGIIMDIWLVVEPYPSEKYDLVSWD